MNDVDARACWPAGGLERVEYCPVCGSNGRTLLYESMRDRIFRRVPGEWTLYQCAGCGCGYLDPRPTPQTIGLAYRRYFTHAKTEQRSYDDRDLLGRLRYRWANGYRNAQFGTNRRPSSVVGSWLLRLLPRKRAILDTEARHLTRPTPGAIVLDIGCGDGHFLELAAEIGWRVEGVDFDPQAVDVARSRGLTVYLGSLEQLRDREAVYDVITLSHVIEHVHDPRALLSACFRLLKPGGQLWLETPNLEAKGHRRYGCHWRGLEPPRHLVLLTWHSLLLVLREAGYTPPVALPRRPVARRLFSESEAIREGKDPHEHPNDSLRVRWHAWWADRMARANEAEFLTVLARKPVKERNDPPGPA